MCTVLLPAGVNPIAVNKYIILNIFLNKLKYDINRAAFGGSSSDMKKIWGVANMSS